MYRHETLYNDALDRLKGFPFSFIGLELFQGGRGAGEAERGAKPSQKLNAFLDACSQRTTYPKYIVFTQIITSTHCIT